MDRWANSTCLQAVETRGMKPLILFWNVASMWSVSKRSPPTPLATCIKSPSRMPDWDIPADRAKIGEALQKLGSVSRHHAPRTAGTECQVCAPSHQPFDHVTTCMDKGPPAPANGQQDQCRWPKLKMNWPLGAQFQRSFFGWMHPKIS